MRDPGRPVTIRPARGARSRVSRAWSGRVRPFLSAVTGPQRASACRALLDGAVVVVVLKRSGLRPLLRNRPDLRTADPDVARQVAHAVDAGLGMLPVPVTCLRRSVALLRELDRKRLGADLRIGVRRGTDGIEAHAWVEVEDQVINDEEELVRTFLPLAAGAADRLELRWT